MSNRTKILRTLLVLGIVACIAGGGVFSAFSSKTENPGNVATAGTVELEDNDGGTALYAMTAAKPGDSKTSCIKVTYKGSLPATVKLYTPSTIGELGPNVTLKIEAGTQTTSTFPASATKWETNNSVVYRVTATLSGSAPDIAQGKTTGSHILRWEAQNQ